MLYRRDGYHAAQEGVPEKMMGDTRSGQLCVLSKEPEGEESLDTKTHEKTQPLTERHRLQNSQKTTNVL